MIDHTDTPFKTMGFCPHCQRYTAHVCAKCQPADPRDAEIAALTAERDALREALFAHEMALEPFATEWHNHQDSLKHMPPQYRLSFMEWLDLSPDRVADACKVAADVIGTRSKVEPSK